MNIIAFDTNDLPAGERFACWYEMSRRAHIPTRVRVDNENDFRASTRVRGSAALRVSVETVQCSMQAERTSKLIRASDPEEYMLGAVLSGTYGLNQLGREITLGAGDLVLLDSSRSFHACYKGGAHQMFWLPKALLPLSATRITPLLATRLPGRDGIGGIIAHCMSEVTKEPTQYQPIEATRLLDIAVDLLAALLAHELDTPDALPPESHQRALLVRIHAFIHQHLGDPGLSPKAVAHAHHISLRRLQQLFAAADTTPASWIRQRRLEQCLRALVDRGQRQRPIRAIAARYGFTDHAHFSRLFRLAYGTSPSEYRATHDQLMRETTSPLRD